MGNNKKKMKNLIILNANRESIDFKINAATDVAIFRKQVLKAGEYNFPNSNTRKINFDDEYFDLLIKAFNENAVDNVPIIVGTHDESKTEKIIGRITGLEKEDSGLYAIMEIVDEEIVGKIETELSDGKGIIDEVSVYLSPTTTDEGKEYLLALMHVAVVTHGWYQGMDSFERLAAMLRKEDSDAKFVILTANESLDEQSSQVRVAFYNKFSRNRNYDYGYDYWVDGVYDDFVIVRYDEGGKLFRYDYTENSDGEIEFEEGVEVEKAYVEANKVDIKEVLAALKEQGIEIKDIDELKALMASKTKFDTISAALNPDDKGKDTDYAKLVASVQSLIETTTKKDEKIDALLSELTSNKADVAVDKLVEAGKVTPAQKDHFVALYGQSKDLFVSITAGLGVIVATGQEGKNGGTDDNSGGDIDPDKEKERILAARKNGNKESD